MCEGDKRLTKFFDRISHSVLLRNLKHVLGCDRLETADFKIYRRMTAFEWVDADKLDDALSGIKTPPGRICNARQFREQIRSKCKLVKQNLEIIGIPQGTPLSGLYANISLVHFDIEMKKFVDGFGGFYRRYSDDIAVLAPPGTSAEVLSKVCVLLSECDLELSAGKTIVSNFSIGADGLTTDSQFQYLGFTFDGTKTLIRQSSMNRYYSKMSRGVKSKVRAAKNGGIPRDTIFLRQLFKSYTHFGRHRNFPRYAYRASKVMHAPEIRRQLRNHMKIFKRTLNYYLDRAY